VLSDDGNTEIVYRYTIPNLESLNVQYNTPISPMPLPEEDADENILVKIEGNSASIDIDWTLADYTYTTDDGTCHFEEWNSKMKFNSNGVLVADNDATGSVQELSVTAGDTRGKFNPLPLYFVDMSQNTSSPSKQVGMFREFFESKSLNNDYLLTIEDGSSDGYGEANEPTTWYGSISQMSFSISGSSPIVWRARMQFFVGNVITVFDPDSPESPQSLSGVAVTGDETANGSGIYNNSSPWETRQVIKVRFKDPSSFGATDANEAEIMYREEGKLKWTSVIYNIQTNVSLSKSNTRLTKYESGTDNEYYVVYLPTKGTGADGLSNTDGETNYNLTSGGLFDITQYQHDTTPPANSGTDTPSELTLKQNKFYTIKVHFRNTSGNGGLSEDTVQMKNNP
jgi:hypothetical protein